MLDFNDPPPQPPAISVALRYAEQGIPVFPCHPATKRPLVEHGFKAATTDAFRVRQWWSQFPNAMIGAPTGQATGWWVLDIDTDEAKGKQGLQSLASLGVDLEDLMDTAVARTGSGGYHVLFRFDPERPVTNARGSLPPHLDVRGEGGYVILAGSQLADGRRYEWVNPPEEIDICDPPGWLTDAISGPAKTADIFDFNTAARVAPTVAERVAAAVPGTWHERTRDLVARMVREGASDETIAAIAPQFTEAGYTHQQTVREFLTHARTAREKWGYQATRVAEPQQDGDLGDVYRILSIRDLINIRPPEWRIEGIFPMHGSSTIYGAYESFKTFVALDMLLSLASGQDWQGRASKCCPVLYIAGEGQFGVAQRVTGWCHAQNNGRFPENFHTLPEAVAIPPGNSLDKLLRTLDSLPEMPGVIALDTVTRMSGGGSLNDEKDMQAYVMGMDRLRQHTGAHIMNIGHSGKDKEKGLLGSIVLPAAMETIICVERTGDTLKLVNSNPKGKQKDGPNFEDIRLRTHKVEFTQAGEVSSTLILVPDDAAADEATARRVPHNTLGKCEEAVMAALAQAAVAGRELGLTALVGMVNKDRKSVLRAANNLVGKNLAEQVGEEGARRWKLA